MTREVQKLARIVGAAIASRRKQKGMTQTELAERLRMGADSLSRIEKGVVAPRFPRLEEIAKALGCRVADLFRSNNSSLQERAESIADILRPLPPDMQDEMVFLIEHMVAAMLKSQNAGQQRSRLVETTGKTECSR